MKTSKSNRLYLRIRTYVDCPCVDVWIILQEGAAHCGMMHGWMTKDNAERIAGECGLPVEREESPLRIPRDSLNRPIGIAMHATDDKLQVGQIVPKQPELF